MSFFEDRRTFLGMVGTLLSWLGLSSRFAEAQQKKPKGSNYALPASLAEFNALSVVLGRAGEKSITISLLSRDKIEAYVEYGLASAKYEGKAKSLPLPSGQPVEFLLEGLKPDSAYFYRVQWRKPGESDFQARPECQFHTQRAPGSTFTFCIQGDSHPERPQMSEPNLYARTLLQAAGDKPDLYICMGDDFSVARVQTVNAENLAQPYLLQRPFLGLVAKSAPIYLVNGNHEQASLFNFQQKDERHDVALGVQNARNKYFPMPAPEGIYTGDEKEFKGIGLLRDYFAWTWGDALFVVLDNYWHSPTCVDTGFRGSEDKKNRDWWDLTLGEDQYQWLKKTLAESKAKHKFVFAHHVLGTGRGGVEECDLYEWGGKNRQGVSEFKKKRPDWEWPVHQLMAKHGVTIFFQGHDHLYARQDRDGVIYQEVPIPADPTYTAFNEDAYKSGTKLPNTGYLRVVVSPKDVKVDYVRCWLPKDETEMQKTGEVVHSYTVKAKV